MNDYKDIINYNYTGPKNHQRMDRKSRAFQFGSFKALSGYDDELKESRRIVNEKIILDEDRIEVINQNLLKLQNILPANVKLTYFIKDLQKEGGFYRTISSTVKKIDNINLEITLLNGEKIK